MKKDSFLKRIQQDACFAGSRAAIAWEVAIKTEDNDPKWDDVEDSADRSQMMNSFSRVFGVELPKQARRKSIEKTAVERLEEKLETLKASMENVDEKTKAQIQKSIDQTQKRLEMELAIEEEEKSR